METVEATGATIQEAVDAGMKELGVENPSQVMVEVLQEPDKGIMGEGARPAIVRLLFMGVRPTDTQNATAISRQHEPDETIISSPVSSADDEPFQISSPPPETQVDPEQNDEPDGQFIPLEYAGEDAQVGREVLETLLDKMGYSAQVAIYKSTPTKGDNGPTWILNITGREVNRLIGRRGDTLSSLQYIMRLIVSRRLQRRANIVVDVEGYKSKRSNRLGNLAKRMADQAVKQGKTVSLEPMPPHERRIIHLTLRKRKDVTTKSVGDGDKRRVTITPMPPRD
jgi:spoIIIJ-associated protein